MNCKKWFVFLLSVLLLLPVLALPAFAAGDPVLQYEVLVDGLDVKEAEPGDIVTVTLYLQRTDADEPYTMYGMQSELRYDSNFFELVEDSIHLHDGVQSTDIGRPGELREFYMNFVSFSGGVQWQPRTRVGSFQLRVIGTEGVATITNEDYLVSRQDGSGGGYACESNELTVILTADCTVKFETNGGSQIDPASVIFGEKLSRPQDPTREGKVFGGWYKDIHLSEEWDFGTDTVQGSMTLYAKWTDAPVDPTPGGDPVDPKPGDDPVDPKPGDDPDDPKPGDDPTPPDEPTEPGDDEKSHCAICGRENTVLGLPLCGLCLLILILILLVAALLVCVLLRKRTDKQKNK